jgi:hypothetical protein
LAVDRRDIEEVGTMVRVYILGIYFFSFLDDFFSQSSIFGARRCDEMAFEAYVREIDLLYIDKYPHTFPPPKIQNSLVDKASSQVQIASSEPCESNLEASPPPSDPIRYDN